jgi:hypothetical protein
MRRLRRTIYAYWWWQFSVRRKLNVLNDGPRVFAFELERVVWEQPETGRPFGTVLVGNFEPFFNRPTSLHFTTGSAYMEGKPERSGKV